MNIVPEDKDWTWVITSPCPDCGYDGPALRHDELPGRIRSTAAYWASLLSGDPAALTVRPRPDVWSTTEYGCHVRDTLRIFDGRLARMLAEDDPLFANWDQDATAVEDRYDLADPHDVGPALAEAAATIADRFDTVTGDQWSRPGRRSNGSNFTIDTFARYFLHDPVHHLWDVTKA